MKILFILSLLFCTITNLKAQDSLYVMQEGSVKYKDAVANIDSVIFYAPGEDASQGSFTVEDSVYGVNQGLIYDASTKFTDDANFFTIYLLSDGFTMTSGSSYTEFSGTGNYFEIQLYSDTISDNIEEGAYTYDTSHDVGTFISGDYILNYDKELDTYDKSASVSNGAISIEKDGYQYIINIICQDEDGNSITGYYKGDLDYSDISNLE